MHENKILEKNKETHGKHTQAEKVLLLKPNNLKADNALARQNVTKQYLRNSAKKPLNTINLLITISKLHSLIPKLKL